MYWALSRPEAADAVHDPEGEEQRSWSTSSSSKPHELNPQVPENLSNFVMECVRTNPAKRPDDMAQVISRLEIIQHVLNREAAAK